MKIAYLSLSRIPIKRDAEIFATPLNFGLIEDLDVTSNPTFGFRLESPDNLQRARLSGPVVTTDGREG